ncbi:MAG: PAS domain S-box protein [Rhodocyclaceae bacterium]|nr:PAS domain S-box protein [Rhodocyclaceae bacterium]MBX3667100.1 PAS domain S-box protein [Rhodocyclaceae bacterium]
MNTFASAIDHAARSPRGRWYWNLPYAAVAIFALAMLATVWGLQKRETDAAIDTLARDMQWAEQTMRLHLSADEEFLAQISRDLAGGAMNAGEFQVRANEYLANNQHMSAVVRLDAQDTVRWSAPFDSTERVAGERLGGVQAAAVQAARSSGRVSYTPDFVDARGRRAVEIYVPVQRERAVADVIAGVYPVDGLLQYLVPTWFAEKYRLAIVRTSGERVASAAATAALDESLSRSVSMEPLGQLRLVATVYRTESAIARIAPIVAIVGLSALIVASLAVLRLHLARRLRAERERDALFSLSLDLLCIQRMDGSFVRVNPAFKRVLGYSQDDMAGRALLELAHEDDISSTVDHLRRLASGLPVVFENRCRCADGEYKWVQWNVNPVPHEKLVYAVGHDVTQRRAREEALNAETAFRRAMEESVVTGLRMIALDGTIRYVNRAFMQMTGFSEDELVGCRPPYPYWPADLREELQTVLDHALSGRIPPEGWEVRIQHKNGECFDVRQFVSPFIDGAGRHTGWMSSMHDITDPKRARAELEQAHARFVTVLDGLDAAVFVADVGSGEILYANRAFKQIYGFDAVGCKADELTRDCQAGVEPVQQALAQLGPGSVLPAELLEAEICHARSGRWYNLRERALRWVDGRIVRMQVATDVTDRKLAAEEADRQQQRLQQTARLITMGEMASSLAHELNQPLAAITNYAMGCVARLESGNWRQDELLGAMRKAGFQAERAGKIVRRMRDFVRWREPCRANASLPRIIEEAVGFAEIEARKTGARIHVDLPEGLPEVYADPIMIEQVVLNLVKNGVEAMHDTPAPRRDLHVGARVADGMVAVHVADQGHGIDKQELERLFAPFFTTKPEGMGMGLNICRSIIEFHEGRLWAEPNAGGGSVFRFTLPHASTRETLP